jgi:uncharacterized protein YhfF
MTANGTVSGFWERFCKGSGTDRNAQYQTWYFGNSPAMALELAELVIAGKKTATASLAAVNEVKPHEAPVLGGISVVTDFYGAPMCVICTTKIEPVPFNDVGAGFAALEGEGDLSLDYWRRVHREYFLKETAGLGLEFSESSLVCCEQFELLFP